MLISILRTLLLVNIIGLFTRKCFISMFARRIIQITYFLSLSMSLGNQRERDESQATALTPSSPDPLNHHRVEQRSTYMSRNSVASDIKWNNYYYSLWAEIIYENIHLGKNLERYYRKVLGWVNGDRLTSQKAWDSEFCDTNNDKGEEGVLKKEIVEVDNFKIKNRIKVRARVSPTTNF